MKPWLLLLPALATAAEPLEFSKHIRSIFAEHCVGCHNHQFLDKPALSAGLALDSYDSVIRGGKKPVVIPGDAARSELLRRVEASDPALHMPKGGPALPPETVGLIRQWIAEGAREGQQSPPPSVPDNSARSRITVQAIDVFIPFGARKPLLAASGESRQRPVLDIPGAIVVDEEAQSEKIFAAKYSEGLNLKAGPLPPATAVAFSPDGSLLVGAFGMVAVWDLDRKEVTQELTRIAGAVNNLAFSPDRKLLALAGGSPYSPGEVRLYEVPSLKPVATLAGHKEVILNQAFSPDSKRLATVSYDKTAEIWDLTERRRIGSIKDHSDTVQCVAFDREGKTLATGGMDRIVKLSDGASGKGLLTINPELKGILALAFSPNGKFLVTSGESPEIRWWDVANMSATVSERGWIPERKMAGHSASVHDLRFSPDGKTLASASADHTVRLWDAESGAPVRTLIDADDLLYSVAFSPDSKRLAAAGGDGLTRVWDLKTGALQLVLAQKRGASLAVEPNGHYKASASWKDLIHPKKVQHAKND